MHWSDGVLIERTPQTGYNSDPNICICSNGKLFLLWRECYTPIYSSLNYSKITIYKQFINGQLENKQILCINKNSDSDAEQCPIMIENNGKQYIYAVWYQYDPIRKNKGVAIWHRNDSNEIVTNNQEYQLIDTLPFKSCYTVDKCAQIRLFNHIWYLPKPLCHDLWHFDLFEYESKLYMVSVAENGDNIMLSVANDFKNFNTYRKPLVNNHYTENYCGYRQHYYKPTAFVQDDTLHLFYTSNAQYDTRKNQLFHTSAPMKKIIK
ncbi:MAG: hypothetical protein J5621_07200 [Paludibacteraceae bacterium]|nr:hypothetical protein [Paludibacteraceae bacterium]